jgi:hypothetical protein
MVLFRVAPTKIGQDDRLSLGLVLRVAVHIGRQLAILTAGDSNAAVAPGGRRRRRFFDERAWRETCVGSRRALSARVARSTVGRGVGGSQAGGFRTSNTAGHYVEF